MAQGLPRTHFNSSRLVRVLADLSVADAPESKQSFAERLGQWLDFKDSLSLYSALQAGTAGAPEDRPSPGSPDGAALRNSLARVRSILTAAIAGDDLLHPGKADIAQAIPPPQAPAESAADFALYHRRYLAHQRDMGAKIAPLRASARTALSRRSPALKRLAVLDAVLEQGLSARERDLLAKVPALLGRRFEQLYEAHQATLTESRTTDDPQRWTQPGAWLAVFCKEMQAALQAELELRLQPVAGLIGALDHDPAVGAGL